MRSSGNGGDQTTRFMAPTSPLKTDLRSGGRINSLARIAALAAETIPAERSNESGCEGFSRVCKVSFATPCAAHTVVLTAVSAMLNSRVNGLGAGGRCGGGRVEHLQRLGGRAAGHVEQHLDQRNTVADAMVQAREDSGTAFDIFDQQIAPQRLAPVERFVDDGADYGLQRGDVARVGQGIAAYVGANVKMRIILPVEPAA